MTKPSDTSPEAERFLIEVYRNMPLEQKWRLLGEAYQDARALHAAGVRLRQPNALAQDIDDDWLKANVGCHSPQEHQELRMDQQPENLRGLREVIRVLTDLDIPYALGGSMASSVYGVGRYTRDADITVEPFTGKERQLVAAFGPAYYISRDAIRDALQRRSSFNIIHAPTGFKVDAFVRKEEPFEISAMARRISITLPDESAVPLFVHSPEDIVLFKLRWYRLGNETSDAQWGDILGVLRVQAGNLDEAYLDKWAAELKVSDLLSRARKEAAL